EYLRVCGIDHADRDREKECDHADRFCAGRSAQRVRRSTRSDLSGLPCAIPPYHDDHDVGDAWLLAHCSWLSSRRRSAPESRVVCGRWSAVLPIDHFVSDTSGVHVHGGHFRARGCKEARIGSYGDYGRCRTLVEVSNLDRESLCLCVTNVSLLVFLRRFWASMIPSL